jgi:hypothetical protein
MLIGWNERGRSTRARLVDEPNAGVERDEEVARTSVARVGVDTKRIASRRDTA